METSFTAARPPRWYWIVTGLALIWMLFGVTALIMDVLTDEAAVAELSDAQRALYAARPGWLFGVYAVATLSGLAGVMGLLLRRSWSVILLAASLLAVVLQFGYTLFVMDAIGLLGAATAVPFPLLIFVIGAALLWLGRHAAGRGWLSAG